MTLRCRTLVAALALPLLACGAPTVPDGGLQVTLTVDRMVLPAGDTAQVTVVATNRAAHPVTINAGACPEAFVVLDARGAIAGPASRVCTASLVLRELAPGEAHAFHYAWALDGAGGTGSAAHPLPAGVYEPRGRVVGEGLLAESSPVQLRLETPAAGS